MGKIPARCGLYVRRPGLILGRLRTVAEAEVKVAVFSDVQGNLPALEVVVEHIQAWDPDLVILNGDLVNRGPNSLDCLKVFERLRAGGWLPLRGNHEDYVLHCLAHPPRDEPDAELRRFTDWTARQLADRARLLTGWADHLCFQGHGTEAWVHVTHGTLAGNRDGVSASVPDSHLANRLPSDLDLFVTAHTHKPLLRRYGDMSILNVGSVGSPFDGDARASYGRLELVQGRWRARIVRLDYDRARTERDFRESGFLEEGGALARLIFEEWRRARPLMPEWNRRFRPIVARGHLSPQESVRILLAEAA